MYLHVHDRGALSDYHLAHQISHRHGNNSYESPMKCISLGTVNFKSMILAGAFGSISFHFHKFQGCVLLAIRRSLLLFVYCKPMMCCVHYPTGDADGAVSARQVTAAPWASGAPVSLCSLHALAGGWPSLL